MGVLAEEFLKVARLFGGEEAAIVVKTLLELNEATDQDIANKTEVRLNTVRKILYKLYDHSLVSVRRERDDQTGWYIFHWRLQPEQLDAFIRMRKKRILERLKTRLEFEKSTSFFICRNDMIRVTFDEALETSFKCPKCGESYQSHDNKGYIAVLEENIKRIERELES